MILLLGLVCTAFLFGVLIGWAWKPKWTVVESHDSGSSFSPKWTVVESHDSGSSFSKSIDFSLSRFLMTSLERLGLTLGSGSVTVQSQTLNARVVDNKVHHEEPCVSSSMYHDRRTSLINEEKPPLLTEKDLEQLFKLVEVKDGGPPWVHMMNHFTPAMHYQAWRREPKIGPQYRSRIVFENATPELVRDFFWDDEFRPKWDDMLMSATTVEECLTTGTMVVNWIRKFPFFFRERQYTIGRRIWESGRSYYCVTKGVPCPSIATHNKLRRVDLYYSSWCIRAESRAGGGQQSACEVLLFHHEEMGIPREIAKLRVRKGMWEAVKKFEHGLRAYQEARASGAALSRSAFMAHINTNIDPSYLRSLGANDDLAEDKTVTSSENSASNNIPKILVFGGAVVIACSVNEGFLHNAVKLAAAKGCLNLLLKLCGNGCPGSSILYYLVNC